MRNDFLKPFGLGRLARQIHRKGRKWFGISCIALRTDALATLYPLYRKNSFLIIGISGPLSDQALLMVQGKSKPTERKETAGNSAPNIV